MKVLAYLLRPGNIFYNLETIHSGAYPEVLEELKQNTIYNNVPKTFQVYFWWWEDICLHSTQWAREEGSVCGGSHCLQVLAMGARGKFVAGDTEKELVGKHKICWNDGRLGIEVFNEEKMGEYFQHHLLFILLSFLFLWVYSYTSEKYIWSGKLRSRRSDHQIMPSIYVLALHSYIPMSPLYFLTWLCKKSIMIAALSTLQNHGHIVQNKLTPSPFGGFPSGSNHKESTCNAGDLG